MVPNTPPPPSNEGKGAHKNAGEDQKWDPRLLLNILNDGWISVKERLPEPEIDVLVWNVADLSVEVGFFEDGFWELDYSGRRSSPAVTHWQPLPNPPKNP